jgi:hypothetical protein
MDEDSGPHCPICGEPVTFEVAARVCEYCKMGIATDRPYYQVFHPRGFHLLCSQGCVRAHVLAMTALPRW